MKHNPTLKALYLCNNPIGDDGVIDIAETLKVNTTLSELDLGGTQISTKGINHLAMALGKNKALNALDLTQNNINIDGFIALYKELKNNTNLTKLDLSVNGIDLNMLYIEDYLDSDDDIEANEEPNEKLHEKQNDFFTVYSDIRKICRRNSEKELLLANALPVLKVVAPEIPTHIANLLTTHLLITEDDAVTLRKLADLV